MASIAEQLKLEGLEHAVAKHGPEMARALLCAELLAMGGFTITADDVRTEFEKHYARPLEVGNALGKLFTMKKGQWEFMGRVKSKRKSSHGRFICSWRLRVKEHAPAKPFDVGVADGEPICVACGADTEACTCPKPSTN